MLFAGDVPSDCCATGTADARELSCWDWARNGIAKHDAVNTRKRLTIEYLLLIRRDAVDPLHREQVESDASVSGSICVSATIRETERGITTLGKVTGETGVQNPSMWSPRESYYCYSRLVNPSELAPLARWARQWPEDRKTGREERESVEGRGN